jgi:acyl-CoA reductase-like NAD-dependent aldehyde dehydrogenase
MLSRLSFDMDESPVSRHFTLMPDAVQCWRNVSPGDLSLKLPEVCATPVEPVLEAAANAARAWSRTPIQDRFAHLREAQQRLAANKEELARGVAMETGKPLTEARGEVSAVISKFDLTIQDAGTELPLRTVADGPHPAWVRRVSRGPAAVVGPFNFPLHLANGAIVAHLAAGNPVIFKPSPLAAVVAQAYADLMTPCFPHGVFQLVQGGGAEGRAVCVDSRVRAVCFTGSVPVGKGLARELAEDFSKDLALELGGRNAAIVCADADLDLAARSVADAISLTCGQRCNATSRILVAEPIRNRFAEKLLGEMKRYAPGDPLREETTLGPLINEAAMHRFEEIAAEPSDWLLPARSVGEAQGKKGYYVKPGIRIGVTRPEVESFVPIADLEVFRDFDEAIERNNASPFGLAASVFTRDETVFWRFADEIRAGNIYANLPTTFSPSTLPFGGLGMSGNGRPGGRGFVRFCSVEQAIQLGKDTFRC